jgi:predicted enzyme related to lactoylglutathione lyase
MSAVSKLLVNIDVDDLDHAVDFYTRAFGWQVGRRLGDRVVEMLGASAPVYLLLKSAGSQPAATVSQVRDYARHWTPVHLDIVVGDVDAAVAAAMAAGALLETPAADHVWGRIAHLADPFGHGFCLLAFRNRGYDEVAI